VEVYLPLRAWSKYFLIFLMMTRPLMLYGQSIRGIQILETSSSGKSLIADRGTLEGVKIGDLAKLYFKESGEDSLKNKYFYIGEGEVIKVHRNYSFWYLRKLKNFNFLKKNNYLYMITMADDKRRPLVGRGVQVFRHKKSSMQDIEDAANKGVPKDLIFGEDDFVAQTEINKTITTKDQDFDLRLHRTWKKRGTEWDEEYQQEKVTFFTDQKESGPYIERIIKNREREVFSSTAKGNIDKHNKLPYSLRTFYADVDRGEFSQATAKTMINSYAQKRDDHFVDPRAINRLNKEGKRFSASLNDRQLREYFIDMGIEKEVSRQKDALKEKVGHEFNFHYTSAITSHTTADDPNFQSTDYAVSLGYEYHLYNANESFRNFTAEVVLERGISHYDLGGVNARLVEGSVKFYLNWYFWNAPQKIDHFMPYMGLGFRRGNADGESPDLSKEYQFQLLAFPSFKAGLKYRFKAGDTLDERVKIGTALGIFVTQELVNVSVVNTVVDDINSSFTLNQTKFGIGMSIYY
jgi:hypothetical protein